jgi:histone-arginine methyltransferase CARM1
MSQPQAYAMAQDQQPHQPIHTQVMTWLYHQL